MLQKENNKAKFRGDLTQHLTNKMAAMLPGFKDGEQKIIRMVESWRSLNSKNGRDLSYILNKMKGKKMSHPEAGNWKQGTSL